MRISTFIEKGGMMILNLKIVKVDSNYCDYLRKFDNKVPYNKFTKELRPFIGVLFKIDDCEYFAPLSSPKLKHLKMKKTLDFFKIKNGELGAVNFNNMIPVEDSVISQVDVIIRPSDRPNVRYYKGLLNNQIDWCNQNSEKIIKKAQRL